MNEWITIHTFQSKTEADQLVAYLSKQGIVSKVITDNASNSAPDFCVSRGCKVQVMDDTSTELLSYIYDNRDLAS